MKGIIRLFAVVAVVVITAFAFMPGGQTPSRPTVFGKHFESRCDTLTRGSDTIVNCIVRCSNPLTARDTMPPLGEYKYIEATLVYSSSIDTVKFQVQNPITKDWYQVGVWDLTAADNPYIMNCYNAAAETRRFRIGMPYPLRVRAILASPASYSVRSVQVIWEGSGE